MIDVDELKRQLGLSAGEELELVSGLELDAGGVGLGFAPSSSLWPEVDSAPHWQELPLGAPIELFAWEEQRGVFRVWLPTPGALQVHGGESRRVDERSLQVDARREVVTLRASLESGDDLVLRLGRTECRFLRILAGLEAPALESLTGGLESEVWLNKEYRDLAASPGVVDRVAAVGLVLRLWQPTSAAACRRLVEEAWVTESPLVRAVAQWAARLPPEVCGRCAAAAMDDAEALEDALAEIDAVVERGDDALRALGTHIALERDRLQSLVAVLALRGDASRERSALERLDEQASALLSQLSSAGIEHPLLARAAEVEPFAWWGSLASA
jgi:hypothetical protein